MKWKKCIICIDEFCPTKRWRTKTEKQYNNIYLVASEPNYQKKIVEKEGDTMRRRFLTVPLNKNGMIEYDHGVEESPNIQEYLLPIEEFDILDKERLFDKMNGTCGLLIDDFESEMITSEMLGKCLAIIEGYEDKIPVFTKAINQAIEKKTALALDF